MAQDPEDFDPENVNSQLGGAMPIPKVVRDVAWDPQQGAGAPDLLGVARTHARELVNLGTKQLAQQDVIEAISSFGAATRLDPSNFDAKTALGLAKAALVGRSSFAMPVVVALSVVYVFAGWLGEKAAAIVSFYFVPYSLWVPYCLFSISLAIVASLLTCWLIADLLSGMAPYVIFGWFAGWYAAVSFDVTDVLLGALPGLAFSGIVLLGSKFARKKAKR